MANPFWIIGVIGAVLLVIIINLLFVRCLLVSRPRTCNNNGEKPGQNNIVFSPKYIVSDKEEEKHDNNLLKKKSNFYNFK